MSGAMLRRTFLRLLGSASILALPIRVRAEKASDRGIGGTGSPRIVDNDKDRGIGGTGVIGTIRRFGSIVVNGLRITYPPDVTVRIDGRPASAAELKIGQVVCVATERHHGILSTHAIDVTSEVVGYIERVSADHLTILGQDVSAARLADHRQWYAGDHVAVSGLRRPDGVIEASLIERRSDEAMRVAGPVAEAPDGNLRIGALRLIGADPALVGQRAILAGRLTNEGFQVTESESELSLFGPDVEKLSIESYLERSDGTLHVGSGFAITPSRNFELPANRIVRAVITTTIRNGALHLDSVYVDPRGDRADQGYGSHRAMEPEDHINRSSEGLGGNHPGSWRTHPGGTNNPQGTQGGPDLNMAPPQGAPGGPPGMGGPMDTSPSNPFGPAGPGAPDQGPGGPGAFGPGGMGGPGGGPGGPGGPTGPGGGPMGPGGGRH